MTQTQIDNRYLKESEPLIGNKKVTIQLHEFPRKLKPSSPQEMEKETKVEKSPSIDSNILDEIRFADDDSEELDLNERQCNINNLV